MAALFRIAVVSAIFYLARYALAHTERKRSNSSYSQKEDSVSASEGSSEKIVIKSGVPLRGRTIHHTAWSEEDKVLEPNKDTTLQQTNVENGEEKFYDSWSLTKAFNYILSFIYDMEDGTSSLVHTSPENSKEKSKLQNGDFDELMVPQTHAKENAGNISMYNNNQNSLLQSTPSYLIAYFQNQDIDWFENGVDYEDQYTDYHYEDNELLYADSEYEVELSHESEDESAIDEEQRGQLQDTNSKTFTGTEYETEKTSERKRLLRIKENEPEFNTEHVLQKSRESEQEEDEKIRKEFQEGDIKSDEDTKSVHTSKNLIHETRNEMEIVKKIIHHSEKPTADEHSIDNENSLIDINPKSNVNEVENINWREKTKTEKKPIQPKNQDNKVSSSETDVSTLKPNENHLASKRENTKSHTQSENYSECKTKLLKESEISNENLKKRDSLPRAASNDIKNNSNEDVSLDINYLEKRTIKGKHSTSNIRNGSPSQMKEEKNSIKVKISDLNTHGHSQPKEDKIIIEAKPPTSAAQKHSQHKEQSLKSDHQEQNEKIEIPFVENNQGGKHEGIHQHATKEHQYEKVFKDPHYGNNQGEKHGYIHRHATTEHQYDKVLKDRTRTSTVKSIVYNEEKSHQSRIHENKGKERVQLPQKKSLEAQSKHSDLQNDKSSNKPLKEKDTKHLKAKMEMLSDLYIDLEPDKNVGSYNYLLDSFEFIRVDENNQNKVKTKQDSFVNVLVKDEKHGAQEKATPILSEPHTPFKHQSEPEKLNKSHEVFGTILEYLYKNSNSSFLLSLKEYNSSEF